MWFYRVWLPKVFRTNMHDFKEADALAGTNDANPNLIWGKQKVVGNVLDDPFFPKICKFYQSPLQNGLVTSKCQVWVCPKSCNNDHEKEDEKWTKKGSPKCGLEKIDFWGSFFGWSISKQCFDRVSPQNRISNRFLYIFLSVLTRVPLREN